MANTSPAGYIVYQSGHAIFGTGATLYEALDDANKRVDPVGSLRADEVQPAQPSGEIHGRFYHSLATRRLIDLVRHHGGAQAAWSHNKDGVADLAEVAESRN